MAKRKNPWLAAVLNFIFFGVGYIYNGKRIVFGILLTILAIVSYIWCFTDPVMENYLYNPLAWAVSIIFLFALAFDAYQDAKKFNSFLNPDFNN